jgi:outer membrane protein TolC
MRSADASVSLTKGFSTGTTLTGSFSSTRIRETSTRLGLDPYTTGAFSLSVVQPLWRGAGVSVNRRFIHIAQLQRQIADDAFRAQVIQTVFDVIRLYWDYVSLTEDAEVKRQTLAAAERLQEDTRAQVETGTQAPIQLTQAQALVATSRQSLNDAEGLAQQQELLLKEVLTRRGIANPALAAAHIVPLTQSPSPEADSPPPLAALLDAAVASRPDLVLARRQLETASTSLIGSRNALHPALNVVASLQGNGLAGRLNPNAIAGTSQDPTFIGAYSGLLGQIARADYLDAAAGIQLTVPLQNRVAKADAARDLVQLRQASLRVAQFESQVRLEVGNALIAAQRARISVEAAVDARKLQEAAVAVEHDRFDAGVSTTYNVIQMEANLALARSAEVSARGVYAKARAALDRATASTLDTYHVLIDDARTERVSP